MDKKFITKVWESYNSGCKKCPPITDIISFFEDTISFMFPPYNSNRFSTYSEIETAYTKIQKRLYSLIKTTNSNNYTSITNHFLSELDSIRDLLYLDARFISEHDPASTDIEEVIRTYPGFFGISAYRIAHALQKNGVQIIPRVITEYAHSKTGIDIHPSAKVGSPFFIDHGTAIVIGSSCIIGDRVQLYQNVTLGALSVSKEDANKKRHPTIEDDVIIYSGVTILGGETVIGKHSVIGGNVWLIKSVPEHSKIYYSPPQHREFTVTTEE